MLLERCGLDADTVFDVDDFRDITNFNTPDTINELGCATSDISEMVLREIEATVRSAEREENKNKNLTRSSNQRFETGTPEPCYPQADKRTFAERKTKD